MMTLEEKKDKLGGGCGGSFRGEVAVAKKYLNWEFIVFPATKQDRVGPSLQSINTLFTSVACCAGCTMKLDL